jgi:photosystem II stability/assembly factor-like uncharacterized protein
VTGVPVDPNGSRYDDVWFVDPQHGWTADSEGRVYGTVDGGATWDLREVLPATVRSMAFLSPQHGFLGAVVDSTNLLWETTDGGDTFVNITSRIAEPRPSALCGMWAVDASVVVGVGHFYADPYFIRTSDGGASWTSLDLSGLVGGLVDVRFFDGLTGVAVGRVYGPAPTDSRAAVIRTVDGGASWTLQHVSSGAAEWAWKISFPSDQVGYVAVQSTVESDAKILKTIDGGITWVELPMPPGSMFSGIGFVSEQAGWVGGRFPHAAGQRSMAVTTDGGATWNVLDEPIDPSVVNRIRFFHFGDETAGYASGGAVYRYYDSGTTTAPTPDLDITSLGAPVPNPFVGETSLPFQLAADGWVRLEVFDLTGRAVDLLINRSMAAGRHEATWDGRDSSGRLLPAGAYLYRMETGGTSRTGRAILFR